MSLRMEFHGAAGGVTGSCHLVRTGGLTLLVDCGLFQGGPKTEAKNRGEFGFDPAEVDYLLLTHGHLDHCGRIPLLVKRGFRGKIACTAATADIAKVVLTDSARIQEEDYARWSRIAARRGVGAAPPLYSGLDVLDAMRLFRVTAQYDQEVRLNDRVAVTFRDAGHILGSAFLEIEVRGRGRLVFSGDLGNRDKPVIRDPAPRRAADVVVIESTYATRDHRPMDATVEELRRAVVETFERGGNVVIPSFAIERAQDLLFYLRRFHDRGELPPCKVFLDSPMAIRVTEIMKRHPDCYDARTAALVRDGRDPLDLPGLVLTRSADDSRRINAVQSHAVIIAGSGMCTGGRIKHHLKHNIWREECSLVFVGYQARGTLGRRIVDGRKRVRIFGEPYRVAARVHTIGGFSAHADRSILLDWLRHGGGAEHLFVVHGEAESLHALETEARTQGLARRIHVPEPHQAVDL